MKYCKIKSCVHFIGTKDSRIHMFRTPTEINWRTEWESAIKNEICSSCVHVCINHFNSSDYVIYRNGLIKLKKLAVPTIFATNSNKNLDEENQSNEIIDDVFESVAENDVICGQCLSFKSQITNLSRQCDNIKKEKNDIEAKLKQQIEMQAEQISNLTTELNKLKGSDLNRFISNPHSPKAKRQMQILSCLAVGMHNRQAYPETVRNFCIGLNNTSPAAYRYLRKEFDDRIPASSTIRAWYSNSNINCKPGIIEFSLGVLERKVAERAAQGERLIGGLIFDEMSIYKLIQWVENKIVGYENIPGIDYKDAQMATEALVFMFSSVNETLHLPVAYFFASKSIDASIKSNIVTSVIEAILDRGVVLTSVTFDGFKTNPSLCQILGAKLCVLSDDFDPTFSVKGIPVNVIFDPSHVVKLIRGILAKRKVLFDSQGNKIKWEYFVHLVRFNDKRNLGFVHKMTAAHIGWSSNPMKVILAVQTFSATNANAMEFFMNQNYPEFIGAEHTIRFIRIINNMGDVFNSTVSSETKENMLKRPISAENLRSIVNLFDEAIPYIKGLQYRSEKSSKLLPLCTSIDKTGFQGCIINMRNFMDIYNSLSEQNFITRLPTHSLSQDHLENFFGKMRMLNGSNNNPTCQQFNAGMRKLLSNTTLHLSDKGNCMIAREFEPNYKPHSDILTVTSRRSKAVPLNSGRIFTEYEIEEVSRQLSEAQIPTNELIDMADLTIAHIAYTIEEKIENSEKFPCACCRNIFIENDKVHNAFQSNCITRRACRSTFEICRTADYFLKLEILKGQFESDLLFHVIFSSLSLENLYVDSAFEHTDHKIQLVQKILCEYIRIKCHHICRTVALDGKSELIRRKLMRLAIFQNR